MRSISSIRKLAILLAAVLAGICLFSAVASARLENTIFDTELHISLFEKCNIYSQTSAILKASMKDYLNTVDSSSPETTSQQEQLVDFIEKAITPEMIKLNVDSMVVGLLEYIKSETRFLPDLYINPVHDEPIEQLQTDKDRNDRVTTDAITDIDKINLSVILMYMNRSDITDKLSVARLMQFILLKIPYISVILFAIFTCCSLLLMKSKREFTAFFKVSALTCSIILLISGISLLVYLYYLLPSNDSFISLSVPLQAASAVSYLQNLLSLSAAYLVAAGILLMLAIPLIFILVGNSIKLHKSSLLKTGIKLYKSNINILGGKLGIKAAVATICLIIAIVLSCISFSSIKNEFLSNDLTVAVERMRGITSFSRVVYAQDAAVNTLELRIIDRKENKPIHGIYTKITGKSAKNGEAINEEVTSDSDGKSKTTLDIGSYKLSFDSFEFPDNYKLPPPYLFEMSAAGSTVITISLDKLEEPKPGIIEVQILNKDNMPVKGLELALVSKESSNKKQSDASSFSYTNAEGIAAFRTPPGIYQVTFLEDGFPEEYLLPDPIETDLDSDETARYSIKLAAADKES